MTRITILEPGMFATVQDFGRFGLAAQGISGSGCCDRAAHRLANALVGNHPTLATLEVTLGGLVFTSDQDVLLATAGARCPGAPHVSPIRLMAGEIMRLGIPKAGLRTYLAVRGGIDVPPVLGSRSTDVLSGLGPDVIKEGTVLPVGSTPLPPPGVDVAPVAEPTNDLLVVPVTPGPRRDWFDDEAWALLLSQTYVVDSQSNRVGVRLQGEPLRRSHEGELTSEGILRGAVQIPPSGQPVIFLADHPVTGGYPTAAYVEDEAVDHCAQLRPGQRIRFRALRRA